MSELPSIPEAISDLPTLRLFVRHVVEGTLTGIHRSGLFGSSIEFAEHKPYSWGDDLRHVDWKALGRADKYYLKRFEDETNLRAYLVLDASASTNFGTVGYSKCDFSVVLAAALAYLLVAQQDLISLLRFGIAEPYYVPPRSRMSHFEALSEALSETRAGGVTKLPEALSYLRDRIHRRAVVIAISDFLCPTDELLRMAKAFRSQQHEVLWVQVLDPAEIDFPFEERARFRGMEGEGELEADGKVVGRHFRNEMEKWLGGIRELALAHDIRYRRIRTDEPLVSALTSILT